MFVKQLFSLPDQVRKGDFVLKLTEGIQNPSATIDSYVFTPALADAFDRALGLVESSVRDGRSHAAFLHGSFGSGKSHFMAILSFLLRDLEEAWRAPELHGLRDKHSGLRGKNILQLHFHMIGEESIESAVFRRYVEFVRKHHPNATLPGLFADEELFDDARRMLDELGEGVFFAPMNERAGNQEGWGDLAASWNRERFEQLAGSIQEKDRELLFTELVNTRFRAYAAESRRFVDIDAGLATLSRHAKSLGYDCVVLFLDELILWLSHRASEGAWLHSEIQKMVKLVEAYETSRPAPICSFIVQQRSLVDMVGREHAGADVQRLSDALTHWRDRFDTIVLEDRNLPAIVERRILRPRSAHAKTTLDDAFAQLRRTAGASWDTLLGQLDADAFRKLYPFSPALVEALVALSSSLQKQRTAIKLMLELLVEHIDDIEVGQVVRVGDLFDVLAGADDPADSVMKARFESAKQLYKYHLLPMLQQQHGTTTAQTCQRERDGHPIRLGCSGCANKACRNDNRIVKTLLVAALVPEVKPLKTLTASRIAQLNHGSLKVPIPGTEGAQVTGKLKKWAAEVAQIHVGNESDPIVRIMLEGVDTRPILDAAREHDTHGARQRIIRDLLFDAFKLDKVADWATDRKVEWRGTKRLGHLRFGNVRRLGPEVLRCADDHDWRLLVDYPFDEKGFGPNDDLEAIERFVEDTGGTWTLAWLPDFFSSQLNEMLGDLVILEHVLADSQTTRKYVSHLSVDVQSRAVLDLENLRNQKRNRILNALESAYGLKKPEDGDIDPAATIETHLVLMMPGATLHAPLVPDLGSARDVYVEALLDARYPRHPSFTKPLSHRRVEMLVETFGAIIDTEDKRVPADRTLIDEMRATLQELGLVRVTENAVHLLEDQKLQELEKRRMREGIDQPTAGEVRRWLDDTGKMGLQPEAEDLVVRCYARWAARTFSLDARAYEPKPGQQIPDDALLEKPDLPGAADWKKALDRAGHLIGVTFPGKALHADNLKKLESLVSDRIDAAAGPCTQLASALSQRCEELREDSPDRLITARSAESLTTLLRGKKGIQQVQALVAFEPNTSARAVGASLATASETAKVLGDNLIFGVFSQLEAKKDALSGAAELLDKVHKSVRQDEVNEKLAPRLRELAEAGQGLLRPPERERPKPGYEVKTVVVSGKGPEGVLCANEFVRALERAVKKHGEKATVSGTITITTPEDEE